MRIATSLDEVQTKAKKSLKEGAGPLFASAFPFFLLFLVSSSLAVFSILLSLVAFLLLALPYYFSYNEMSSALSAGKVSHVHRNALAGMGMYFVPPYRGSYRVLWNLLKVLGIALAGVVLTMAVYGVIAYAFDPAFTADFDAASKAQLDYTSGSIDQIISNSVALQRWGNVSVMVGVGCGYTMGFVCLMNYSLSPTLRFFVAQMPSNFAHLFYNKYFDVVGKYYWRMLFTKAYGLPIVVPLSYFVGAGVCFAFTQNPGIAMAAGLGFSGLFATVYLPLFSMLIGEFWDGYRGGIMEAQVRVLEGLLNDALKRYSSEEDSLKNLRKDLDEAKEHFRRYEAGEEDE